MADAAKIIGRLFQQKQKKECFNLIEKILSTKVIENYPSNNIVLSLDGKTRSMQDKYYCITDNFEKV